MKDKIANYRVIDIEHHYNLESMLDEYYLKTDGVRYKEMSEEVHQLQGPLLDLGEGRIKAMDEAGVDFAHLSLATPPGVEWFEPETGKKYAALANDLVAAAIAAHPDRLGGFITIYPDDIEWSLQEIDRAAALGLYGWMAASNFKGEHLDDPKYWPILAKLEQLGMPVYIHPEFSMVPDIAEFGYCINGPSFGFMVDALTCFMRMVCRGVFDKYPNLKVILGHDGEALPFLLNRVDTAYRQYRADKLLSSVCEYEHEPSYYILHNVWLTTSGNFSTEALRCCIDAMPQGRVMMSTDYSLEDFAGSVSLIRDNDKLTDAEKKAILGQNAMNLGFGKLSK